MALIRILFGLFCCLPVFAEDVDSIRSSLLTKEYVTDESQDIANTPLIEAAIENDTNKLVLLLQQELTRTWAMRVGTGQSCTRRGTGTWRR